MPYIIRDLPTITFSSGATLSPAVSGLDDATNICIFISSGSTGSAYTFQVEPSDTGTLWRQLTFSTGSLYTVGASQAIVLPNTGYRQLRVVATAADNSGSVIVAVKQITV